MNPRKPHELIKIFETDKITGEVSLIRPGTWSYSQSVEIRQLADRLSKITDSLVTNIDRIEYKTPRGLKAEHLAKLKAGLTAEDFIITRSFMGNLTRLGTLEGGFWTGLSAKEVTGIQIDSKPCCVVSVSELMLNMAYTLSGFVFDLKNTALTPYDELSDGEALTVLDWMLSSSQRSETPSHIAQIISRVSTDYEAVIRAIEGIHRPISKFFYTGHGELLKKAITDIHIYAALTLIKGAESVLVMPTSTGLIVSEEHKEIALRTLKTSIQQHRQGTMRYV